MIVNDQVESVYSLSPLQESILFETIYDSESALYLAQSRFLLQGRLNVDSLRLAWRKAMERHSVLRTAFVWRRVEKPQQIVLQQVELPFTQEDWSALPEGEQALRWETHLSEDRRRPFDLSRAPLFRLLLARLGDERYELLFTYHHLILDGWSHSLLIKEVWAWYLSVERGTELKLPRPPAYGDYIEWLRQQPIKPAEAFWRDYLKGFAGNDSVIAGNNDKEPDQSFREIIHEGLLESAASAALWKLARKERLTINTLIQGAWALLLSLYTRSFDVVFGAVVTARPPQLAGSETMIGLFIQTVPVRVQVDLQAGLVEWLRSLQQNQAQRSEFDYLSLTRINGLSDVPKGASLFESVLAVENYARDAFEMSNGAHPFSEVSDTAVVRAQSLGTIENARYKLTLTILPEEGLRMKIGYIEDPSRGETRILEHFLNVLRNIAENPNRSVGEIEALGESERLQLLEQWNTAEVAYPQEQMTIQELLAEQARQRPDAIAIVYEAQALTYGELNRRANQLGHYLQKLGIGPETRTGVCLESSPEMVIGLLGILKAEGAYVPLDPEYPAERLAYMCGDVLPALLLTKKRWIGRIPADQARILCLDEAWEEIQMEPQHDPPIRVEADGLAYVIYTSGSTGRPKGVAITYRGLTNLALSQIKAFAISPASRVLQYAPLIFDASVAELVDTFAAGATLVLTNPDELLVGESLKTFMERERISVVMLTPSILATLEEGEFPGLETLVVAGEVCPKELVKRWSRGRRMLNAYGPTEITVCASISDPLQGEMAPIGRPLANARLYVLDELLKPAPVGVARELYVGGKGVARGYWRKAGLTAERFLPNPFSRTDGERMYRTGDRVMWRPDGQLEFLGRMDQQVKVHGCRVEPAEIEAILMEDGRIREAAVLALEDKLGQKRLVAYFTASVKPETNSARIELWPSVAEYFVYDEALYYAMTHDERRNASYRAAIAKSVRDKVCLDIGTGPDAILARLCIENGARKVYAIELLEESYRKACEVVQSLGVEDRVCLILGDALKVQLPEPVDVCVSEIVGSIGGSEGAARILNDARRFLAPGGTMIPESCETRIAAVRLPALLRAHPEFSLASRYYVDQIFRQVGRRFDLRVCIKNFPSDHVISETQVFEKLNFTESCALRDRVSISLTITDHTIVDGFLLWLRLSTIPGEVIDILDHSHSWLPVFVPAFYPGVEVSAGDRIQAICDWELCAENGLNPDYCIEGTLIRTGRPNVPFKCHLPHYPKTYKSNLFYQELFAEQFEAPPSTPQLTIANVRNFLRSKLPEYMIPGAFVLMEAMPLTSSGKLDRRALPVPEVGAYQEDYVAPRSKTERTLAKIWAQALRLPAVGINDNFFTLGGDSILGMQIVARARQAGLQFVVRDIFHQQTIAGLAEVAGTAVLIQGEQGPVIGQVPFTETTKG